MRILVDTHILLWHMEDDSRLPNRLSEILQDPHNLKVVSLASLWEIAIKTNIGKLEINYPLDKLVPLEFQILNIEMIHLLQYQGLPVHHRDPFDRILIAQAVVEDLQIMTVDESFKLYHVDLIQ